MLTLLNHIGPILTTALALYAVATGIFLISENRRPQATLAGPETSSRPRWGPQHQRREQLQIDVGIMLRIWAALADGHIGYRLGEVSELSWRVPQ